MAALRDVVLPPDPPRLVDRERELGALRERLGMALAGRGSLVLIGGEAGIGKTALAEALLAEAGERGALVLVGRCYDLSETPPYGPWRDALAAAPRDAALPALPAAVLQPGRGGAAPGSQGALVARVREYLAALAARRPLVLLLDDLHWADPASLALLRVVGRHAAESPLLLLAAYRADEMTRGHPLSALLPILVREGRAARLDLRPLGEAALRALVAGRYALPPADEERVVDYLVGRSEGNPFFAGELLRALEEDGALRPVAGGWAAGDLPGLGVPPLLRQVVDTRVDRLGEEAQALLALAAAIGPEPPLALWARVAGVAEDRLLDVVERAVEAHLLRVTADGLHARFVHALIREALYEGTPPSRRRAWHREVGAILAARPAPDPDLVAHHFRQAGDRRAAAWLARAGIRAQDAYAYLTAADRFAAALAALAGTGEADRRERAWLLVRLARVRSYAAPRQAIADLDEASRLAADIDDPDLTAYATFLRGDLRCSLGEVAQGLAEMEAGATALAAGPASAGRPAPGSVSALAPDEHLYRGTLVYWLADTGHYASARAMGERYQAGAGAAAYGPQARLAYADAWMGLGDVYASLGLPEPARRAFAQARALFRAGGHFLHLGWVGLHELRVVLRYAADDPVKRRLADEAEQAWRWASGIQSTPPLPLVRMPLLVLDGRWAEALEVARDTGAQTVIGPLARDRGDADLAWRMVREWLPLGLATAPGSVPFLATLAMQRLAAALALDGGDPATARDWLAAHDRWLAWSGAVLGRAEGALGWAAYHRATGTPAQARASAEHALAHASRPRQPLALLAAHRALGELAAAAGRLEEATSHLEAALALAGACGAPYERALTLLALAELHHATGQREATRAALDEARAICEPLGAKPALARADALAALPGTAAAAPAVYPAGLTAREAEVLRLVARGLSNAAVADALSLSPRTVNTHLTNIYAKLGVASRAAAVAFAFDHGLR